MLTGEEKLAVCDSVMDAKDLVLSGSVPQSEPDCQFVIPQSVIADDRMMHVAESAVAAGQVFSVRNSGNTSYRWLQQTSRYFSEISITIRCAVLAVFRTVKHFIRHAATRLRMALVLRKTVYLRL